MSGRHGRRLGSALPAVTAMGLVSPGASAHMEGGAKGQDKCYGVAKAGQNSCSNLSGTHSCAGEAAADHLHDEWTLVPKGTCAKLGGMTEKRARAAWLRARKAGKAASAASAAEGEASTSVLPPAEPASR
ncbi:MAG: DUF2282 domain-containing protein [Aquabacterium sp.]